MKLYLARHGEYVASDMQAPLSDKGVRDIKRLADFIGRLNIHVADIFHSGKLRAQQTADLLTAGFICQRPPQVRRGLNPNDEPSLFAAELQPEIEEDMLIVGHLPFLARLSGKLTAGDENREVISFQAGTIACLENHHAARWIINWVLSPELLNVK